MNWQQGRAGSDEQQVAVIDLGSNSWRLVVFTRAEGSWWRLTDELYETVRIGAGLDASGRLGSEAMQRGLETIGVFSRFCAAHGLHRSCVHVVATSAIRDAVNRDELIDRARERTGMEIEVLSETDEARLGYVAAVNTTTLSDGAVVELGGGSLQLVTVSARKARSTLSLPLGALRLTERFLPDPGPARKKDLRRLRAYVHAALAGSEPLDRCGSQLVGVGGAVRNLAAAAQRASPGPDAGVQGYVITRVALEELVETLAALPAAQRGEVPGVKPGRGDIILAAAVVLEIVMELGDFPGIEATEAGLREGLFLERTLLAGSEPLLADVRRSAVQNLAAQYEPDLAHAQHVATLSLQMHDSLVRAGVFRALPGERELLWAAGMLHDVGMTISYDDHHKHSRYLIMGADLYGFDPRERALIAQITRYHRKGAPKLGEMAPLAAEGDEELLCRCAVTLRLAEHLERGRDRSVAEVRLVGNGDGVDLHLEADGDLTLPRWSLERYGDGESFRRVFGRRLVIG